MRQALLLILFICGATLLFSVGEYAFDANKDGKPDKWYVYENGYPLIEKNDLNFDGVVDFIVEFGPRGKKKYEEMDFNFDGIMDNFYYYENGKATLQTIDSNFDGAIDIWIYLDGSYLIRYEEDTDFDGRVDKSKTYRK